MEDKLVLISEDILPEVFKKVLLAKGYLSREIAKNSSEACKLADVSRSAFYKYKDGVFYYDDGDSNRIITYSIKMSDEPGILSKVLLRLSGSGANIITVYQNIPVDRVAAVTISFRMSSSLPDISALQSEISAISGVIRVKAI